MSLKVISSYRRDLLAGMACAAVGLIIAVLPNLTALVRHGTPYFLADYDDTYYLNIARAPYHGEPRLRDPSLPPSRRMPTLHSWAMFAPWAALDRALGLPLLGLSLLWRTCGGIMFGASVYILMRRLMAKTRNPTAWALGCALVCIADAGFSDGRTLYAGAVLIKHLIAGTTPVHKPDALPQYRVVTPLLNLPFYLLLAAVVSSPRMAGRRALCLGAAFLAACIYLYFYFWTASVLALVLYAIMNVGLAVFGAASERAARLDAGRFAALLLGFGLLLGAPQIFGTATTGTDPLLRPILERISKGYHVPARSQFHTSNVVNLPLWAKLIVGGVGLTVLKVRGTGYLWTATLVGYVLTNSVEITGLEFENFHWAYCYTSAGEVMVLATVVLWIDQQTPDGRWRARLRWLAVVPAACLVLALVWRPYEALHAPDAVHLAAALEEVRPLEPSLRALGPEFVLSGPSPQVDVALLFSRCSLLNHRLQLMTLSLIPDQELHERDALDAWLRGDDLASYKRTYLPLQEEPAELPQWGFTYADDPRWPRGEIRAERLRLFRLLLDGERALIDRYHVDGLLRPTSDGVPPRGGPWVLRSHSGTWSLWTRP
jgi:hypothetical protein